MIIKIMNKTSLTYRSNHCPLPISSCHSICCDAEHRAAIWHVSCFTLPVSLSYMAHVVSDWCQSSCSVDADQGYFCFCHDHIGLELFVLLEFQGPTGPLFQACRRAFWELRSHPSRTIWFTLNFSGRLNVINKYYTNTKCCLLFV